MRFYYLIITLFLQALNLVAQPADAAKLSSEQIAAIQSQGVAGIQSVFAQSGIYIQDLPSVEAFASDIFASQFSHSSSAETITDIASSLTIALAEIAISENINTSYVIEYVSAGTAHGLLEASTKNSIDDVFKSIRICETTHTTHNT